MAEIARRATAPAKAARKRAAKKTTAKKLAAKKAPSKKIPAKKAAAKKAAGKKAPAKKAAAKKAAGKKAPAKKAAAKKAAGKKAPAKKAAPEKGTPTGARRPERDATPQEPTMGVPQLPAPPRNPLDVLGLHEPVAMTDLRRAWRAYAARHHPDRGGDAVLFARGQHAYDALLLRLSTDD